MQTTIFLLSPIIRRVRHTIKDCLELVLLVPSLVVDSGGGVVATDLSQFLLLESFVGNVIE
jgi:hypothetical protein